MRVVARPQEVDAYQWFPGKQPEHPDISTSAGALAGLHPELACRIRAANGDLAWTRIGALGPESGFLLVRPGDWLITHHDGKHELLSDEDFHRRFDVSASSPWRTQVARSVGPGNRLMA
jgi:hypothetical protein